jgi:hypothetical protein
MQDQSADTSTEAVDAAPAMSFFGYPISVHKLMQNPLPIVFEIRVLVGMFSRWDLRGMNAWRSVLKSPTESHRYSKWNR